MTIDLPSIRARAVYDLTQFRQQTEELKRLLQETAEAIRAVPPVRVQVDTSQLQALQHVMEQVVQQTAGAAQQAAAAMPAAVQAAQQAAGAAQQQAAAQARVVGAVQQAAQVQARATGAAELEAQARRRVAQAVREAAQAVQAQEQAAQRASATAQQAAQAVQQQAQQLAQLLAQGQAGQARTAQELRAVAEARRQAANEAQRLVVQAAQELRVAQQQTREQARLTQAVAQRAEQVQQLLRGQTQVTRRTQEQAQEVQRAAQAEQERLRRVQQTLAASQETLQTMQRQAREARVVAEQLASQAREARSLQFRTGFAQIAAGGVLGGLSQPQVDLLRAAARATLEFGEAMARVRSVLSPEEIRTQAAALEQLALFLGRQGLGVTAVEAARALEELAKAGLSTQEILRNAPAVLALAATGEAGLAEAARLAASAMTTFQTEGLTAAKAADILAGVSTATIADVDQLRQGLQQVSAAGRLTNQSFQDLVLALGLMAQAGIVGSDAGTSLRVMLLRLQPESAEAAALMQRFGLIVNGANQFIDQATGRFKSLGEIAEILRQALQGLTVAQRETVLRTIFMQDAVRAATVMLEAGAEGFARLRGEAEKTTVLDKARERLNSLAGDLRNLQSVWQQVLLSFGQPLEPDVRAVVQALTGLLTQVRELPPEVRRTLAVLGLFTAATTAATAAATVLAGMLKVMGLSFTEAAAGVALIGSRLGLLGLGLAALVVAWQNNWFRIRDITQQVVQHLLPELERFRGNVALLAEAVGQLGQNLGTIVLQRLEAVAEPLGAFFRRLGAELGARFGEDFGAQVTRGLLRSVPGVGLLLSVDQMLEAAFGAERRRREEARREQEAEARRAAAEPVEVAGQTPEQVAQTAAQRAQAAVRRVLAALSAETTAALQAQLVDFFQSVPERTRADAVQAYQALLRTVRESLRAEVTAAGVEVTDEVLTEVLNQVVSRARQALPQALAQLADTLAPTGVLAARVLQAAQGNFDRALVQAGTGPVAEEIIQQLVEWERATKDLTRAVDQELNPAIAAQVQVLRNEALQLQQAALATADHVQAAELMAQAAAKAAQAEDLRAAHVAAAAQTIADARALERIALEQQEAPQRLFEERARTLIDAVLPALTAAQQVQIRQLQLAGEWWEALRVALDAVGVALADVAPALTGSNALLEEQARRLRAVAEASDPARRAWVLQEEALQRFVQSAVAGLPAAQRAQVEFVAASQGAITAIRQLWQQLGLDIARLPDLTQATAAQLQQVLRQIEARATLVETGQLLPATPVRDAAEQFRQAAAEARERLAEARERVAQELETIRARWREGVQRAAAALVDAWQTLQERLAAVQEQLTGRLAALAEQAERAVREFERRMRELAEREQELREAFERERREREQAFVESQLEQMRRFQQQAQELSRGIAQAVADAVRQQREQLLQLSQQLADLRAREADQARRASERLQDLATKELLATTPEERSRLAQERVRLQAEQGAQAVALQQEIMRGQAGLHQTLEAVMEQAMRQLAQQLEQQTRTVQEFKEQQARAAQEFARQQAQALEQFQRQLEQLERQRAELAQQHAERLQELRRQREEAEKQAQRAREEAVRQFQAAERRHQEQLEALRQQREAGEARAERELQQAEARFQQQMQQAQAALVLAERQAGILGEMHGTLREAHTVLEAIADKLDMPRQVVFNLQNMNVEEGDVEFLERAAEAALEAVTQG